MINLVFFVRVQSRAMREYVFQKDSETTLWFNSTHKYVCITIFEYSVILCTLGLTEYCFVQTVLERRYV